MTTSNVTIERLWPVPQAINYVAPRDPADTDPAVAEAARVVAQAHATVEALRNDEANATIAHIRAAREAVEGAEFDLTRARSRARSARQRERDAALPELEREIAAIAALEKQATAAQQRRRMAVDDENRIIGEMNTRLAAVAARAATFRDVDPLDGGGPIEVGSPALGWGVRVNGTGYCRQAAVTTAGGFVPYRAPVPTPVPAPPARGCTSAYALGLAGRHVIGDEINKRTDQPTGRKVCLNCGQVLVNLVPFDPSAA